MAQTNLDSDKFCIYNQSAAPILYALQPPSQQGYNNTFATGTVGINASSNHIRPDVINIDSYLSGRDDILSKCNPPVPALDSANEPPLKYDNGKNLTKLQPIYSREKKSAIDLSSESYLPLTFQPTLPNPPQNPNHIIFTGWAQRGGANTSLIHKSAWSSDTCEYFLDPSRFCGRPCSEVNGYMTRLPYSAKNPEAKWGKLPKGLPNPSWFTPSETQTQIGMAAGITPLTSQLATSVRAASGGPQYDQQPKISNPYAAPPKTSNPYTGQPYVHNQLQPLLAQ